MYLITAYFDDKTNKRIQSWIDKIASATGNHFMLDHNVPPHLTLAAIEARSAEELTPLFRQLEGQLMRGRIELVTVGVLLPYVIYVALVQDAFLQELHGMVCDQFVNCPGVQISRYYQHNSWLPHVTLGKTLDKHQMQNAFSTMQDAFSPLQGQIVRVGLSRVNPHEDVESILL